MTFDVVVIGGGLVGLAIARRVAAARTVLVVDPGAEAQRASWAAAGMLAPQAEADAPDDLFWLLHRARADYAAFVREIEGESGIEVGYRTSGMLYLALDAGEREQIGRRAAWQREAGLAVEQLDRNALGALEPGLGSPALAALRFPADHQVDNRKLWHALRASATARDVRFRWGTTVAAIRPERDGAEVRLRDGSLLRADRVVLAGGAWSDTVAGLPRRLPLVPVHGQLLALASGPDTFRHILASHRGYLVPREDGRVLVGATMERRGLQTSTDRNGLRTLLGVVAAMAPALSRRKVVSHWAGLRPGTADGRPIPGPDPEHAALVYATGHFRNGVLLAPLTGELIGDLLLGRPAAVDLHPFRPDRG